MRESTEGIIDKKSPMPDDNDKPKPVYAPPEQALLPAFKKYVSAPPIDWRKWTDGRGQKIDAPGYKGRMSVASGKIVPPLVGSDGQPIRKGAFQVIRNARQQYVVIDWSKPLLTSSGEGEEHDEGRTKEVMGREVHSSRDLRVARNVMVTLWAYARDLALGLIPDPTPQRDNAGTLIQIGSLVLCRYERGPIRGTYAAIDTRRPLVDLGREVLLKKATNLKLAIRALDAENKKRSSTVEIVKKRRFVGPPISFEPPSRGGAGGSFGSGGNFSWMDRRCPEPGSTSWETCVKLYALTGKWCLTANMIWADQRPDDLVAEAEEARAVWLAAQEPMANLDEALSSIPKKSRKILASIANVFEGAVITKIVLPGEVQ